MIKILTNKFYRTFTLALACAGLLSAGRANAQTASLYSFSQSNGTYTPITGTLISHADANNSDDDNSYTAFTLPFTFNFAGNTYTDFSVSTNGTLFFGDNAVGGYPRRYITANNTNTYPLVSPFGGDLWGIQEFFGDVTNGSNVVTNVTDFTGYHVGDDIDDDFDGYLDNGTTITAIDQVAGTITLSLPAVSDGTGIFLRAYSGAISYDVSGTAPNRTFTVQWSDYHYYNQEGTNINVQVVLHEGGGVAANQTIDMVYGNVISTDANTVQVGLRGASTTDFTDRMGTDWAATTPGGQEDAIDYTSTSVPANGLTYTWAPPAACTGTPTVGTLAASETSVCPNTTINFTLTGNTLATGVTYQWQSRPAGSGAFADISGQTGMTLQITNQTAATDYRVYASCATSTLGDTSNVVSVAENTILNCYCTPSGDCSNEGILNVTFAGLNNTSAQCDNSNGYTDFTSLGAQASVAQATVTPISVTTHVNSDPAKAGVWIDYDHNGVFDASEYTDLGSVTGGVGTDHVFNGNVSIPGTALLGVTRMRVRSENQDPLGATDACSTFDMYGEAEDYLVTITAGTACTGQPSAGTVSASATTVCPNTSFTLTANSFTTGTTGLNLQWQSSPAGAGTYTDISGATSSTYTVPAQSAAMDYRVYITCTGSALGDTSASVSVAENDFSTCYCTNGLYNPTGGDPSIEREQIIGTTLDNSTPGYAPTYYTAYPQSGSTTATLAVGVTYTLHSEFSGAAIASIWIDYDHSGTFDANEWTQITTNAATADINFTIPNSALLGATGLRIRSRATFNNNGAGDACSGFGSGETEDYVITIVPGTPCNGQPSAGTISSNTSSICPLTAFTLTATGYTSGVTGTTVQWQSSPAGAGTFTDIVGATNGIYTVTDQSVATDYRFYISCSAGNLGDTSNVVSVGINAANLCYCTDLGGSGYPAIDSVHIYGTTLINSTPNELPGPDYQTIYPASGNTTATLTAGLDYTIHLTLEDFSDGIAAVWIDYDHSGTFDANEYTSVIPTDGFDGTATITIPGNALTGLTGMRVRSNYYSENDGPTDACSYLFDGETEDYYVTIAPGTPCSGTPDAGTITGAANACPNVAFTLTATGYTAGVTGLTYQWLSRPAGSTGAFTPISGATTAASYTVPNQTAATEYALAVVCGTSTLVDTSNIITVGQNAPNQCYCIPQWAVGTYYGCNDGDDINDFSLTGDNSTAINDVATGCSAGAYDVRTNESIQFTPGSTYTGSISSETTGDHAAMWIDFNDDGAFDASEEVATIGAGISTSGSSFSLTVPAGSATGTHRMRVRVVYNVAATDIDPCDVYYYGEVHDYTAIIGGCATPLTVNLGNDTTLCPGASITLDAGNAGSTYAFSNGDITQTSTVTAAGTYYVTVTSGACTGSDTIHITAAPAVTVNLGNDTTICSGATITLDAGNAGSTFAYSNGGTNQTTSVGPGTYSVTVTSTAGCVGTDAIVIGTAPNLVVNLGNDTAICAGNTITLDAGNFGAGTIYDYSNGGTNQTTSVGPGAYSVTVTNAQGCSGTDNIVISTSPAPVVNLGNDTSICVNGSLVLHAGTGTNYTYSWSDGSTADTLNVTAGGTYSVTVTNGSGCSSTDAITIGTIALPTVTGIGVNAAFDPVFGFSPQGATNTTLYGWSFGDGDTSTSFSPTHNYANNGAYTVILVVGNACGFDSVSTIVNVNNAVSIANTAMANGALSLYPNPVSNFFILEAKNGVQMQRITVLNNLGAVVYQSSDINATRQVVNIDNLAAGIYNVRIQTDKGTVNRRIEAVPVR